MRLLVQPEVEQRFWDKVNKLDNGCWAWKGAKTRYGIGRFKIKGKSTSVHRFAYEITHETVSDNAWIIRKTFCPTPGCCNPDHLTVGDRSTATQNGYQRGNVVPPLVYEEPNRQGSKAQRKFTPEQVKHIRTALADEISVIHLSQIYQVDTHTIYSIKKGEHYKDV